MHSHYLVNANALSAEGASRITRQIAAAARYQVVELPSENNAETDNLAAEHVVRDAEPAALASVGEPVHGQPGDAAVRLGKYEEYREMIGVPTQRVFDTAAPPYGEAIQAYRLPVSFLLASHHQESKDLASAKPFFISDAIHLPPFSVIAVRNQSALRHVITLLLARKFAGNYHGAVQRDKKVGSASSFRTLLILTQGELSARGTFAGHAAG